MQTEKTCEKCDIKAEPNIQTVEDKRPSLASKPARMIKEISKPAKMIKEIKIGTDIISHTYCLLIISLLVVAHIYLFFNRSRNYIVEEKKVLKERYSIRVKYTEDKLAEVRSMHRSINDYLKIKLTDADKIVIDLEALNNFQKGEKLKESTESISRGVYFAIEEIMENNSLRVKVTRSMVAIALMYDLTKIVDTTI